MSIRRLIALLFFLIITTSLAVGQVAQRTPDDSGMWLLPQIRGAVHAEMAAKGLEIPADSLYHANKPSLNETVVRINIGEGGGGTGSFISDRGLILTNHHVAYDAIASASTANRNYLDNGFYAKHDSTEIEALAYTLYIPIEQTEVTDTLKAMVPDTLSPPERAMREQEVRKQLVTDRKDGNEDLKVEIDDYWAGNRQFMAVYRVIRDVRLVYAPPSSVGKYGGDIDNWMWPRHTGDFTLLRAYVAPDGSGRVYHEENVPFQPDKHLPVNANGLEPGDFTMILGFPGSTYRYQSSYAFEFYQDHRNPYLIQSFQAILDGLEYAAEQDEEIKVANASERASIANALKYYQGVQQGFKRYKIVDRKRQKEDAFATWVARDSAREATYGNVLKQLEQGFSVAAEVGDVLYATVYTLNYSDLLLAAELYTPYYDYMDHTDSLEFSDEKRDSLLTDHRVIIEEASLEGENLMLSQMMQMLASLPENQQIEFIQQKFGDTSGRDLKRAIDRYLDQQMESSIIYNPGKAANFLDMRTRKAKKQTKDEMVQLYEAIDQAFMQARDGYRMHYPIIGPARQNYVSGMMEFRNDSTEYADANFTLRLSGGRVMGYQPEDGLLGLPFTTFEGMVMKDTDEEPFDAPQKLETYQAEIHQDIREPGRYANEDGHLIVNFLSTNDITGGNSGSPVLNGDGEIVGLAFDGNIEGVVGDYFYDPELNRTISVDIRYVLFLMDYFDSADRLLNELEVILDEPMMVPEKEAAE